VRDRCGISLDVTRVAESSVSQHLEVLGSAGLVTAERQGRYKFHHIDTAPLDEISARWSTHRPDALHR
jgi:DNA-binding transcriptional ArsR family regulator